MALLFDFEKRASKLWNIDVLDTDSKATNILSYFLEDLDKKDNSTYDV